MIGKAYSETVKKKLPFWFIDREKLDDFHTTKCDINKKISKIPKDPPTVIYKNASLNTHSI